MNKAEWLKQVAVFSVRWPRWTSNLNDEQIDMTVDLWFMDLQEFPVGQVEAAIAALYRDGREFAPNGAQIRLKVQALAAGTHDFGEAYQQALEAAGPRGGFGYGGLDWLRETNPVAAEAVHRYGWRDFCFGEGPDGVRRAQFREIFEEVAASSDRQERYRGIPAAGLKVLEQANSGLRQFGDFVQVESTPELDVGEDSDDL